MPSISPSETQCLQLCSTLLREHLRGAHGSQAWHEVLEQSPARPILKLLQQTCSDSVDALVFVAARKKAGQLTQAVFQTAPMSARKLARRGTKPGKRRLTTLTDMKRKLQTLPPESEVVKKALSSVNSEMISHQEAVNNKCL